MSKIIILEKLRFRSNWRTFLYLLTFGRKYQDRSIEVVINEPFVPRGDGTYVVVVPEYNVVGAIDREGNVRIESLWAKYRKRLISWDYVIYNNGDTMSNQNEPVVSTDSDVRTALNEQLVHLCQHATGQLTQRPQYLAVIRHLKGFIPVISKLILIPQNVLEVYMTSRHNLSEEERRLATATFGDWADEQRTIERNRTVAVFVEFDGAEWLWQVVGEDEPVYVTPARARELIAAAVSGVEVHSG